MTLFISDPAILFVGFPSGGAAGSVLADKVEETITVEAIDETVFVPTMVDIISELDEVTEVITPDEQVDVASTSDVESTDKLC